MNDLPVRAKMTISQAKDAEEKARTAFIRLALSSSSDVTSLERLRLEWVKAGEVLDRMLFAAGHSTEITVR